MKSKNLGIISDPELRLNITTYYDNHVKWIIQSLTDVEKSFSRDWVPEIKSEFIDFKFKQYATPRNSIKWISKEESIVQVKLFNDNREGVIVPLEEGLLLISKIRTAVNSELNQ